MANNQQPTKAELEAKLRATEQNMAVKLEQQQKEFEAKQQALEAEKSRLFEELQEEKSKILINDIKMPTKAPIVQQPEQIEIESEPVETKEKEPTIGDVLQATNTLFKAGKAQTTKAAKQIDERKKAPMFVVLATLGGFISIGIVGNTLLNMMNNAWRPSQPTAPATQTIIVK